MTVATVASYLQLLERGAWAAQAALLVSVANLVILLVMLGQRREAPQGRTRPPQ